MQLNSQIKGIPCIIKVLDYSYTPPDTTSWDSDIDYYGGYEIDFTVLDRKGYPALWLENKLTDEDRDRIDQEIIEDMENKDGLE